MSVRGSTTALRLLLTDIFESLGASIEGQGTATGGAVGYLDDSSKDWGVNIWRGCRIVIYSGTGAGQIRNIASNTGTRIVPDTNFGTAPDITSQYMIWPAPISEDEFRDTMRPNVVALVHDTAVTADTDILAADINVGVDCIIMVSMCFSAIGAGYMMVDDGSGAAKIQVNDGLDLYADNGYMFDQPLPSTYTLNFQHSQTCTCRSLIAMRVFR